MLELDNLHRMSLKGTTNGYKIIKAVDLTLLAHAQLLDYGKYRVMSCIPVSLYKKVRTQEDLVHKKFNRALSASKKDLKSVEAFVKSCLSLIKGYELVIATAKSRGLTALDIDFFNFQCSDCREIYVVPTPDMKSLLRKEIKSDNLCIYTMQELGHLLSNDKIAYQFKTRFDAQLTGAKAVDTTKTH